MPISHVLILLALILPYFINLGSSALWDTNETYYAETPREMLETGNYLTPQFNYEARPQKPPLTYWFVLLAYRVVGIDELGVRLPGAMASAAVILFAYGISRLFFSPRASLLAAAMAATTPRIFILARKLPIDILLLAWLTGAAYFLMRALLSGSRRDWLLLYLCAALGFLTKGPIACAIPVLSFLAWSIWTRRFRLTGSHHLIGALLFMALVAPWYLWMYVRHGWAYIADFFIRENFARFAIQNIGGWNIGPARGLFYYFPVFLGDFFPWSLLLIAAVAFLWSLRKEMRARDTIAFGLPIFWCVTTFLFFSISRNKQEYYIAPIYPLAAVVLGGVSDRAILAGGKHRGYLLSIWRGTLLAIVVMLVGSAIFLPFLLPALIPEGSAMLHYGPSVLLVGAALVLFWQVGSCGLTKCMALLAATLWLVSVLAASIYLPGMERLRPVKEMCRAIQARAQAADEVGYYRAAVPSMVFYLRRQIFAASDPDLMAIKFRQSRRVFCVLGRSDHEYFIRTRGLILYVLGQYPQLPTQVKAMLGKKRMSEDELLIVSNQPDPETTTRRNLEQP